jgi:hypothetical protein
MATRKIGDAHIKGLSTDSRFSIAYDAARSLSMTVVRASGYRIKEVGGAHYNTFLALKAADSEFSRIANYFDICRSKRNTVQYDRVDAVSSTETEQLVMEVIGFQQTVHSWLAKHHPQLLK